MYNFVEFCDIILQLMEHLRTNSKIEQLLCASFSYKTTPVATREILHRRFNDRWNELTADFDDSQKKGSGPFAASPPLAGIDEVALLATCGRVELIVMVSPDQADPNATLKDILEEFAGLPWSELGRFARFFSGWEAVFYLARVAAGLESKVLGESQILGQFTRAADNQLPPPTPIRLMAGLLQNVIRIGKRVRRETNLGRSSVSMGSVAVSMLAKELPDRDQSLIVVVGAGEMARLAVKSLAARRFAQVTVVNRSLPAADQLAERWGYRSATLDELDDLLGKAAGVVCATGAKRPLITREKVEKARAKGAAGALLMLDLGLPPNIDSAVGCLPGVTVIDVDHLQTDIDQSLALRQAEIPHAQAIIKEIKPMIEDTLQQLSVRPLIAELRQHIETIRLQEVARTEKYLGEVDPAVSRQLDHLSRALVNKMFHTPTQRLRQLPPEKSAEYAAALQALFAAEHPRGGVQ